MKYLVTVGDREIEVEVTAEGVVVGRRPVEARLEGSGPVRHLVEGERRHRVALTRRDDGWEVLVTGRRWTPAVLDERARLIRDSVAAASEGAGGALIKAPMPGLVLRLEVAEGDAVSKGQGVVVLEAMKMENEIRAPAPGTVMRVLVDAGTAVEKGAALVEIGTDGR